MFDLTLVYTLFAATFIAAKQATVWCPPFTFVAIRMIVAGLLFIGFLWWRSKSLYIAPRDRLLFAIMAFVHIAIPYAGEFWGIQYVPAAVVSLLYNLSPFFTAILDYVLNGRRCSPTQLLGMSIGFIAMMPIIGDSSSIVDDFACCSGSSLLAFAAVLCAVISCCYGWVLFSQLQQRGYATLAINGWAMLLGGFCLIALVPGELASATKTIYWPGTMSMLLLLIILGNIWVYNLYGSLLHSWGPTTLAFGGAVIPVITAGMQWLLWNEPVNAAFWFSMIGIVIAFMVFFQDRVSKLIGKYPETEG